MKNFKLRAWDEVKKVMLEIGLIDLERNTVYGAVDKKGNKYSYVDSKDYDEHFKDDKDWDRIENLKFMQFTGLCDKNGKEIYNRDIVWDSHKEEYGEVTFKSGEYLCEWETYVDSLSNELDDIEVVGNIYENLELLKENER